MRGRVLRRARVGAMVVAALGFFGGGVQAQPAQPAGPVDNADFERPGLAAWRTPFGAVPESARTCDLLEESSAGNVRDLRVQGQPVARLGGDYWHVPYMERRGTAELGFRGRCVLRPARGIPLAAALRLTPDDRYLWVVARAAGPGAAIEIRTADTPVQAGLGDVLVRSDVTPGKLASPVVLDLSAIPPARRARPLRLVVVPAPAHATEIDDVRAWTTAPPAVAQRAPVPPIVGFADVHVHPMAHQAMGGLSGQRPLWGVPGGRYSDYAANPALYEEDVPPCDGHRHNGHILAPFVINGMDQRTNEIDMGAVTSLPPTQLPGAATANLTQSLLLHDRGHPRAKRAREFVGGLHEQHHITAIRRAYEGGLRLMSSLSNNNELLEYMMMRPGPGVSLTPEVDVIKAHVCGMRQLAQLNADWMEIAYSPDDVERIVRANKLAIVLGVEVPDLGNLGVGNTAEAEVKWLYDLGIRQVTVTHSMDNKLGGAAVFEEVYNFTNEILSRPKDRRVVPVGALRQMAPGFYQVEDKSCESVLRYVGATANPPRGECVMRNISSTGIRVGSDRNFGGLAALMESLVRKSDDLHLFAFDAVVKTLQEKYGVPVVKYASEAIRGAVQFLTGETGDLDHQNVIVQELGYSGRGGFVNAKGLTRMGEEYVDALMRRGMLIDIAHLSDKSRRGVFDRSLARARARVGAACGYTPGNPDQASDACWPAAYPIMWSHVKYRAQAIHDPRKTEHQTYYPREFDVSESVAEMLRKSGGIIGLVQSQDPIEPSPQQNTGKDIYNDCGGSSRSFAIAYTYALQKMQGRGIALGTDATFHAMNPPRFGYEGCHYAGRGPWGWNQQTALQQDWPYQENWVRYGGAPATPWYALPQPSDDPRVLVDPLRYARCSVATASQAPQCAPLRRANPAQVPARTLTPNAPLTPFEVNGRRYDYNVEGWANYGMVVDAIQDARNVGLTQDELSPLFMSAQHYVDMWRRARTLGDCDHGNACDLHLTPLGCTDQGECKGTCPMSPRRGAPAPVLQQNAETLTRRLAALTHDPWQDAYVAVCDARRTEQTPPDVTKFCEDLYSRDTTLCANATHQACHHRKNLCKGLLTARKVASCFGDPDQPRDGDAWHGPAVRLGACFAAKGLQCGAIPARNAFPHWNPKYDPWLARKTCEEVSLKLPATCGDAPAPPPPLPPILPPTVPPRRIVLRPFPTAPVSPSAPPTTPPSVPPPAAQHPTTGEFAAKVACNDAWDSQVFTLGPRSKITAEGVSNDGQQQCFHIHLMDAATKREITNLSRCINVESGEQWDMAEEWPPGSAARDVFFRISFTFRDCAGARFKVTVR